MRSAVIAVLALSACAQAAPPEKPADPAAAAAAQVARDALARHLHIEAGDIEISGIVARTWSDSSMGCRTPGAVAATVITEGYAITANVKGRAHIVHVSGSHAVLCGEAGVLRRETVAPARGIDTLMQLAREDLARRLRVDAAKIRLGGVAAKQWPDSSLGCPLPGEEPQAGPVEGLLLTLRYAGRVYTYHTDRRTVRPCPAIEAE